MDHTIFSIYIKVSLERSQNLKDALRQLKKGSLSVSDYARRFKGLCDRLSAIGQNVDESDKTHWFLCGLGSAFESFSTAHRAVQPRPPFRDLVAQAEGHELFIASIHGTTPAPVAFTAQHQPPRNSGSRGRGRTGRNQSQRGAISQRGTRGRRNPHCQLC